MDTFGDKLKAARVVKGFKQADVAAILECAPTSLTNWENGKIQPSVDVLERLCEVLKISPLDLLEKRYSYGDITAIAGKPAYERTYEEQVALNFSHTILKKLLPADKRRQEAERVEQTASFLRDTSLLERFGGSMDKEAIDAVKAEYEASRAADADILFAFHALTRGSKVAFLDMLRGLASVPDNIQPLAANMDAAITYTSENLARQGRMIRRPDNPEMADKLKRG